MDSKELLLELFFQNDIYLFELEDIWNEKKEMIKTLDEVFKLNKSQDYVILANVIYILSQDNYETRLNYFVQENENIDIKSSEVFCRDNKMLAAAGLWYNLSFFTMAYNWMHLIDSRIEKESNNDNIIEITFDTDKYEYFEAASTEGLRGFGDLKIITDIGKLEMMYDNEDNELYFCIYLEDNAVNKKFSIEIQYHYNDEKEERRAVINHETGAQKAYSKAETIELGERGIAITSVIVKNR